MYYKVFHTGLKGWLLVKADCLDLVLENLSKCGFMTMYQKQEGGLSNG